ncbi:acetoacetate decarboxylase family protein [Micromonospora haikouensis]|uniref:acetoacetate decarboxylase family protein n=1 Tax=Micromonospora haikouensis TaxID=686309 RepID=UPI0037A1F2E3
MLDPADPHLVVHSRMVYLCWLPAAPDAVAALLPAGLRAGADPHVFMNQYVVDDETQTSGLGAYSLTYLGICVAGLGAPGGWWTHYLCSSPRMRGYAAARGAPVEAGHTWLERRGDTLVAQTEVDGVPLIRTRVHVGHTGHLIRSGHHRYVTARDGELTGGVHPYVAEPVTPFEVESVDFLDPDHPVHALRPANPLTITEGFYSPRASFAYPGGTGGYAPAHQVPERRARSGLPSGS